MINPTIPTTMTMTTTFGSLKLWLATTSAAAMLRWLVPRAMTRLVSVPGPPSNQPIPRPKAIIEVPQAFLVCRRLVETYRWADVGDPVEHSLHPTGQVFVMRLQGEPRGQGEQHQQKQGATNTPRINSNARRESDRRQFLRSGARAEIIILNTQATGKAKVTCEAQ